MTEHLTLYTTRTRGTIARETYGHFIEHIGHCIYDGLWVGTDSSIPHINGIRREAIDLLRDIHAPLIRWPGGYFADCYNWLDGIGPRENRPVRFHDCSVTRTESNQFGTHEFMELCDLVGAEPNFCVNTASLTNQDAMNWVEYCNADTPTTYANLRRKNGRQNPWKVRYWGIGNESYLMHTPQDYIQHYLLWRKFMRRVDPDIQCIACLVEPNWGTYGAGVNQNWFHDVLYGIRENMQLASLHLYSGWGINGSQFTDQQYWQTMVEIEHRNRFQIETFLGGHRFRRRRSTGQTRPR